MLIALQDPHDDEKRDTVEKIQKAKEKCAEKRFKKDHVVIPQEWLNPKNGLHINSIDSLLHHEDLVEGKNGREVVEGCLREKRVKRWKGEVTDAHKLWIGTITFRKNFEVRFIPQNVQTRMPKQGETVSFCLGFDSFGLSAWWVRHDDDHRRPVDEVKTFLNRTNEDDSSSDKDEDVKDETTKFNSIPNPTTIDKRNNTWSSFIGQRLQGVVVLSISERGHGRLKHPQITGVLYFHAAQLAEPVITLKGRIEKLTVLEFRVWKVITEGKERIRAYDISVVKVRGK